MSYTDSLVSYPRSFATRYNKNTPFFLDQRGHFVPALFPNLPLFQHAPTGNGQHVFVRSNWAVMTYEKMKIKAIVRHDHTVDVAKGKQLPQRRNYYPHFSEVRFLHHGNCRSCVILSIVSLVYIVHFLKFKTVNDLFFHNREVLTVALLNYISALPCHHGEVSIYLSIIEKKLHEQKSLRTGSRN